MRRFACYAIFLWGFVIMTRTISLPVTLLAAAVLSLAEQAPAKSAHAPWIGVAPASAYRYDGVAYDRIFSVSSRPRVARAIKPAQADPRLRSLAAAPYAITDLVPIAGNAIGYGPLDGYGYPTGVNDAGHITYYDECECAGDTNDIAVVIDDSGVFSRVLYADQDPEGLDDAIPYAIADNGSAAGEDTHLYGPRDAQKHNLAWNATGGFIYFPGANNGSFALAINDNNVSVGQDTGPKGIFAASYTPIASNPGYIRTLLKTPKNTSWLGTATGINDAGEIVGYGTFPGGGRALRFSPTGYAAVLPVGAAGVSTSAQAINVHGDIVGNAGSQAFLYKANRTTLLPRPPGETAGNAVAYAINATDEIVGDIVTSPTTSTAFLYVGGTSYDLTSLLPANSGWQIVHAAGINATGQIVGVGYYAGEGGGLTAFSMKP
jgi:hypothetical protein